MKLSRRNLLLDFILPLVVILLISLVVSLTDIDRGLASCFYRTPGGWVFRSDWPWLQLYKYGMVPGLALAFGGLFLLLLSPVIRTFRPYWRPAAFLLLLTLLGPGFLVHTIGKEMWGRPRPVDTVDFGGAQPYYQVYQPAGSNLGKSFPSGHAAIGFYTIAPFFLLRRRQRKLALSLLATGGVYGALMSIGRMVQGGHYLTDVLWSGYLVYATGMLLYYLLDPERIVD